MDADVAAACLHSLVPAAVWRAERSLRRGAPTEEALRLLLEFHQDTVGPLTSLFAYALPTEAALGAIARHSPEGVVEIGAGGGLWAHLLRERGLRVHAYDTASTSLAHTLVRNGGPRAASKHCGCSLFLCWPPLEEPCGEHRPNLMALEALQSLRGDGALIYVGEWRGATGLIASLAQSTEQTGQTAGRSFQAEAERCWVVVETVALPRWPGMADCLYILCRRGHVSRGGAQDYERGGAQDYERGGAQGYGRGGAQDYGRGGAQDDELGVDVVHTEQEPPPAAEEPYEGQDAFGRRLQWMQDQGLDSALAITAAIAISKYMQPL